MQDLDQYNLFDPQIAENPFEYYAALGRKEASVALSLMLDRFPTLQLAPGNDFAHHPSMLPRGLKRLDIELR